MSARPDDVCLECDAPIPSGASACPNCKMAIVFCKGEACRRPYPAEMKFCPHCNTPQSAPATTPKPAVPSAPVSLVALMAQTLPGPVTAASAPANIPATPPAPAPAPLVSPPQPSGLFTLPTTVDGMVTLEMLVPKTPRKGEQCVVRLRANLLGNAEEAALDLVVECDLWPQKRVPIHAPLTAGSAHELPSLRFVPLEAGAEVLRFEATLRGSDQMPLGRWNASHDLNVEDQTRHQVGAITAEKGASVTVSVMAGLENVLSGLSSPGLRVWESITLQPDRAFQRRLAKACPEGATAPAFDLRTLGTPAVPVHAAVRIEHEQTGQRIMVALTCAAGASFGRGGDPAVTWWLLPAPFDAMQHQRLSRQHTVLSLRNGRAWVCDRSTNGTKLNRQPLLRDVPEMLAVGDSIDPAGVVPLSVAELGVQTQKVHSIWIDRGDGLAGRLRYLLTDGTAPVRLACSGELWLALRRGDGGLPQLVFATAASKWHTIPAGKLGALDGFRILWRHFESPREQEHYLFG